MACMEMETIMLSEIGQSGKTNTIWSHLFVESNEQKNLMNKIEAESWTHGTDL